jgi:hypothetical protein
VETGMAVARKDAPDIATVKQMQPTVARTDRPNFITGSIFNGLTTTIDDCEGTLHQHQERCVQPAKEAKMQI